MLTDDQKQKLLVYLRVSDFMKKNQRAWQTHTEFVEQVKLLDANIDKLLQTILLQGGDPDPLVSMVLNVRQHSHGVPPLNQERQFRKDLVL